MQLARSVLARIDLDLATCFRPHVKGTVCAMRSRAMESRGSSRAELASVASEWTRLATECGRRGALWAEHATRWAATGEERLRAASRRASMLSDCAREMAAQLRMGALELLDVASAPKS
jgi:hypothetical protein